MRLPDLVQKINPTVKQAYHRARARLWHSPDIPKAVFAIIAVCLFGAGAFLAERILSMESVRKTELRVTQFTAGGAGESAAKMYVGSKNGTAYYLPWCGGVKLINEENKIWFASKEDAETKGYKPAGNCKGI